MKSRNFDTLFDTILTQKAVLGTKMDELGRTRINIKKSKESFKIKGLRYLTNKEEQ